MSKLGGNVSVSIWNMTSLEYLYLSGTSLWWVYQEHWAISASCKYWIFHMQCQQITSQEEVLFGCITNSLEELYLTSNRIYLAIYWVS